ncbi:MAG: putative TIM-barrel fold metal-dependent hydrolase [Hyphomicrobiaceae bacterium]|jgi:predicted TIM-barrel fold metal-dependent hydrolase
MPYIDSRTVHDADAHIMEPPSWLREYADPKFRDRIGVASYTSELKQSGEESARPADFDAVFERIATQHVSAEYRADEAAQIMNRKNFAATGSFLREDRPRAVDLIGVASQLVFNTFHNRRLYEWEQGPDLDFAYGVADAHNRGMLEFCSVDARLLPTCYIPLADFDRTLQTARNALEDGAAALLIPSGCPRDHSPSHIGLDPLWDLAQEAGVPIVFHVGGTGELIDPRYFDNGLPVPPDFHGGEENFRSVDYMAIPGPPMQTLATMIFDGVLERFPQLRIGVIEQGAIWLPSWIRQMESAVEAFGRHEERLHKLSLSPTEYVRRQIRVTPYPTEDVGWITEQVGAEICMFSTDFPHVEGGRRPFERFERSLGSASESVRDRFYVDNFVDLMGRGLPEELREL